MRNQFDSKARKRRIDLTAHCRDVATLTFTSNFQLPAAMSAPRRVALSPCRSLPLSAFSHTVGLVGFQWVFSPILRPLGRCIRLFGVAKKAPALRWPVSDRATDQAEGVCATGEVGRPAPNSCPSPSEPRFSTKALLASSTRRIPAPASQSSTNRGAPIAAGRRRLACKAARKTSIRPTSEK